MPTYINTKSETTRQAITNVSYETAEIYIRPSLFQLFKTFSIRALPGFEKKTFFPRATRTPSTSFPALGIKKKKTGI